MQTNFAKKHVPDWHGKLEDIQSLSDIEQSENCVQPEQQCEEWMVLADFINSTYTNDFEASSENDWHSYSYSYTPQQLLEMSSWIKSKKQFYQSQEQNFNVDINTFSSMQSLAYNIVTDHFNNPDPQSPLHLIIKSFAGTGKSYLINALRNLLQNNCTVTATTGKASFNVNGITIHSLLNLPVGSRGNTDLKGQTLVRLQDKLHDIKYILINEYSMIGQTLLGWIDKCCRQATGQQDKVFGNVSIILIGDPAQLPPVADKPLYHVKPSGVIGEQGHLAYLMFDKVVKLTQNQRVQGSNPEQVSFKDLLKCLRTGDSTKEDWQLLLTQQPSAVPNLHEFENAIRLFYGNDQVAAFNYDQLLKLHKPIAKIEARHSSSIAKALSPEEMRRLVPTLFLAREAYVMLTMNLWSEVGLCNGATGKVIDIVYADNHSPPNLPIAVIVQFDYYTGPSFIETLPKCVPIPPITVTYQSLDTNIHERQQIPLKLAWAITIHKGQGLTLSKA